MNSLRMYVQDAVGEKYCFTLATKRDGAESSFRSHAKWWIRTGYKSAPVGRQPCFPCKIVVEQYEDETSS